jgi:hypothetical protein
MQLAKKVINIGLSTNNLELVIAREGVKAPRDMADPDSNRVRLVPPGQDGATQIGIVVRVRCLPAILWHILSFPEEPSSSGLSFRLRQSAPHQGGQAPRMTSARPIKVGLSLSGMSHWPSVRMAMSAEPSWDDSRANPSLAIAR